MIINTSLGNGLFKANAIDFTAVTEATIKADISGSKDPITMLVEIPEGASGEYFIQCQKNKAIIPLVTGKMNYIQVTSFGLAGDDGLASFTLAEKSGSAVSGKGIKVGFIKYSDVVNH